LDGQNYELFKISKMMNQNCANEIEGLILWLTHKKTKNAFKSK